MTKMFRIKHVPESEWGKHPSIIPAMVKLFGTTQLFEHNDSDSYNVWHGVSIGCAWRREWLEQPEEDKAYLKLLEYL